MSLGKRKRSSSPDELAPSTSQDFGIPSHNPASSTAVVPSPAGRLNVDAGFCKLPPELTLEIISYYQSIDNFTTILEGRNRRRASKRPSPGSVLAPSYHERSDTLRALCGTSKAYRSIFLPLLWDRLEICFASRGTSGSDEEVPLHRAIGEAMIRKCEGLMERQDLADMVRTVNVIFTRHKMETALLLFARCLERMPSLRTIHVLDANPRMPNAIKGAFHGVDLPSVRTLIIPGTCHELLKRCPGAESVWCLQGNGNKLVTVISSFCKQVIEVKGFRCEEDPSSMKRLVKGIPNLRVLELNAPCSEEVLEYLGMLSDLSRVDVRISRQGAEHEDQEIQRTVKKLRLILQDGPSNKERYLRLVHPFNRRSFEYDGETAHQYQSVCGRS